MLRQKSTLNSSKIISYILDELKDSNKLSQFELENDKEFIVFLSSSPSERDAIPLSTTQEKLKDWFILKIKSELSGLTNKSYYSIDQLVGDINHILEKYKDSYSNYISYTSSVTKPVLKEIVEYDNLNYITIHKGYEDTGETETFSEKMYFHTDEEKEFHDILNRARMPALILSYLHNKEKSLIDKINNQINQYKSKVKSNHDMHDQKIWILNFALMYLKGRVSLDELNKEIEKYPDSLNGVNSKALIDEIKNLKKEIQQYSPHAIFEEAISHDTSLKEKSFIIMGKTALEYVQRLTLLSGAQPSQFTTSKHINAEIETDRHLSKFKKYKGNIYLEPENKTFRNLLNQIESMISEYGKSKDPLHKQKYAVAIALQKYLRAAYGDQKALSELVNKVKDNCQCFEGRKSRLLVLFKDVLSYKDETWEIIPFTISLSNHEIEERYKYLISEHWIQSIQEQRKNVIEQSGLIIEKLSYDIKELELSHQNLRNLNSEMRKNELESNDNQTNEVIDMLNNYDDYKDLVPGDDFTQDEINDYIDNYKKLNEIHENIIEFNRNDINLKLDLLQEEIQKLSIENNQNSLIEYINTEVDKIVLAIISQQKIIAEIMLNDINGDQLKEMEDTMKYLYEQSIEKLQQLQEEMNVRVHTIENIIIELNNEIQLSSIQEIPEPVNESLTLIDQMNEKYGKDSTTLDEREVMEEAQEQIKIAQALSVGLSQIGSDIILGNKKDEETDLDLNKIEITDEEFNELLKDTPKVSDLPKLSGMPYAQGQRIFSNDKKDKQQTSEKQTEKETKKEMNTNKKTILPS